MFQWAESKIELPYQSICSCWPIANTVPVDLVIILVTEMMYFQDWAALAVLISYLLLSPNPFKLQRKINHSDRNRIKFIRNENIIENCSNLKCELVDVNKSWSSSKNLFSPCSSPCSMRIPPPSVSNIWPTFVRRNFSDAKAWCNCSILIFSSWKKRNNQIYYKHKKTMQLESFRRHIALLCVKIDKQKYSIPIGSSHSFELFWR